MKFTKTLAISLLTLGAMQFAMAEEKTISLNDQYPDAGEITLNGFKKGDTLNLLISECVGCHPKYNYEANDVAYATIEKTKPENMTGMKNMFLGGSKIVEFKMTFKDMPIKEPVIIKNAAATYTIHFNKPTRTLNFTNKTDDITYPDMEKGENAKPLKLGDVIDLVFNENRMVSGAEKRVIYSLPKYLNFIGESFEAPSMDMVGGAGKHHMIFLVKEQPKLLGERLRIKFGDDKMLNIKFVIEKPVISK